MLDVSGLNYPTKIKILPDWKKQHKTARPKYMLLTADGHINVESQYATETLTERKLAYLYCYQTKQDFKARSIPRDKVEHFTITKIQFSRKI